MIDKDRSLEAILEFLEALSLKKEKKFLRIYWRDGTRIELEVKMNKKKEQKIRLVKTVADDDSG